MIYYQGTRICEDTIGPLFLYIDKLSICCKLNNEMWQSKGMLMKNVSNKFSQRGQEAMTPEELAAYKKKQATKHNRAWYKNMTHKERQAHIKKTAKQAQDRLAKMTSEELVAHRKKISEYQANYRQRQKHAPKKAESPKELVSTPKTETAIVLPKLEDLSPKKRAATPKTKTAIVLPNLDNLSPEKRAEIKATAARFRAWCAARKQAEEEAQAALVDGNEDETLDEYLERAARIENASLQNILHREYSS